MSGSLQISPDYRKPLIAALATQAVVLPVTALALDGGLTFQICAFTIVAFWAGTGVLISRRARSPTKTDLSLIRIGFLPLFAVASVLFPAIWHLRRV